MAASQQTDELYEQPEVSKRNVHKSAFFQQIFFFQFDEELDANEMLDNCEGNGRKRLFSKELRCMMYGFGEDQNPFTESVGQLQH